MSIPKNPVDAANFSAVEIERFRRRIVKAESGCHLFDGRPERYGAVATGGSGMGAHRFAYALEHGSIPAGKIVRHRCDVPGCVNPEHLELGSHTDNSRDWMERGAGPYAAPRQFGPKRPYPAAANYRTAREHAGLSVMEASAQLRYKATTIEQFESGARNPDIRQHAKLASFYGVSRWWLLTGEGRGPDDAPSAAASASA